MSKPIFKNNFPKIPNFNYKPYAPNNYPSCPKENNKNDSYCPSSNYDKDLEQLPLAKAYIPLQPCQSKQFNLEEALNKGTLFLNLYKPYH